MNDTPRSEALERLDVLVGKWTVEVSLLTRETPDFTPLLFAQRFIGTFSADDNTIDGRWEKRERARIGSSTSA
jgi:hypothetical protein